MNPLKLVLPCLFIALLSGCIKSESPTIENGSETNITADVASTAPAESTNQVATISQQEVIEAALYGKIETVAAALNQGYKPDTPDPDNRTVLMYAAFNGQTAIAKKLIAGDADINAQDNTGTSALMFAASAPSGTETVQVLLDAGAKIDMIDNNEHFTALMWAAAEGQTENVKLLIENKADASLEDIDGDTAESFAAKAGHTAIAEMLKEYSAKK